MLIRAPAGCCGSSQAAMWPSQMQKALPGLCKWQKSSEGTHLVKAFNEPPGCKRFLEISGGSVVAKHHQGQEKEAPLECTFCVLSFEKFCCYFPGKRPISLVTGPTFMGPCFMC